MKPDTLSFYEQAVHRTARRVIDSLDAALVLEALASDAALSPFHFHRIFRGMVGETPLELHRRLRLERAASHLLDGDSPITMIAFDAGYETHEAFTRAFKAEYGASPSAFRKRGEEALARCVRPPQIEIKARSGIHFTRDGMPSSRIFNFVTGDSTMKVEISQGPEIRLASLRHVGPYTKISEAFSRLGAMAGPAGLFAPSAQMIAVYHDDPEVTPEDKLRSDAAISVGPTTKVPAGFSETRIPAGRYAHTSFKGPYTELPDAWTRLMGEWLPKSGHRLGGGVSYELYRNDPTNTKPEDLLTDLFIPIA